MKKLVVTRHAGLLAHLRNIGLADDTTEVIAHATIETVRGRGVIGVLPMHLACFAASVTEVPMSIPLELRGVELTAEQTARFAGPATTYVVTNVSAWEECGASVDVEDCMVLDAISRARDRAYANGRASALAPSTPAEQPSPDPKESVRRILAPFTSTLE